MSFEKIELTLNNVFLPNTIVCCSGSDCKDGVTGTQYGDSHTKSLAKYGPAHSAS